VARGEAEEEMGGDDESDGGGTRRGFMRGGERGDVAGLVVG
jgi:hypothetical protein